MTETTSDPELRSAASLALATASEPVESVTADAPPSTQKPATAGMVQSVAMLDPSVKQRPDSGTSLINWWYLDLCAVHARHLHRLPVLQAHRSYRRSLGVSSPSTRACSNDGALWQAKQRRPSAPQPRRPASRGRAAHKTTLVRSGGASAASRAQVSAHTDPIRESN